MNLNIIENTAIDLTFVDKIVSEQGTAQSSLIPILQHIQEYYQYLPDEALRRVCELTDITPASITSVSTFYSQFRHKPVGRHLVSICHGTACHVKGSELVHQALERYLKINDGNDTDPDGVFTLQRVACLGCCTLAPVMHVDGVTYGHLSPDDVSRSLQDFLILEKRGHVPDRYAPLDKAPDGLFEIRIGMGSCCKAGGSAEVKAAVEKAAQESGNAITIRPVGCVGMCHQTPLLEIVTDKGSEMYAKVNPEDAGRIVRQHLKPKGILRKIKHAFSDTIDGLLTDEVWENVSRYSLDVRDTPVCAFLGKQQRIATEYCGEIDPIDLPEYEARGGLQALRNCLSKANPDEIIRTVNDSGLRGRGGAGFPTGSKWTLVRNAKAELKYLVCNGDEGDPGAFMDRMILESYPFRVLEGIVIAAYAVGATKGVLYIRAEYPLAVKRVSEAIELFKEKGLLGNNILGSGHSLELSIMEGAGAFVCGEETALIASIEGKRGTPALRPPYPAQEGLWGHPTLVNNVETFAMLPWIMRNGAKAFSSIGTSTSKGTKVFSLAGKIVRGGLIEVPMGTSIREIVEEIGGGVADGKKLKAVQIGGPSGGCIPESLADTAVDYEALTSVGAIMGSGGLVVIDESDCMVEISRYFLEFTQRESCGKCTFCRVGTRRMLDILEKLCIGKGTMADIAKLEELALEVKKGSLCGLGQTAPNPILSTLRHFRHEYEAHTRGICPAGHCRALISFSINDRCIGCTKCAQKCPVGAIAFTPYEKHAVDDDKCIRCGTCKHICPVDAVEITSG